MAFHQVLAGYITHNYYTPGTTTKLSTPFQAHMHASRNNTDYQCAKKPHPSALADRESLDLLQQKATLATLHTKRTVGESCIRVESVLCRYADITCQVVLVYMYFLHVCMHAPDKAHLGRNCGHVFVCIKNQLLKHLEVWEDFEDITPRSTGCWIILAFFLSRHVGEGKWPGDKA